MTGLQGFASALPRLWPRGDRRVAGLVAATIAAAPIVFGKFGLLSDLVIAHAMAQFSHECDAGEEMVENLNYRAEQLLRQWPRHFTPAQAIALAHQPRAIANQAYDGRMGNRPGTDDGWKYRGRGAAQTTGRDEYDRLGQTVGLGLLDDPDLVIAPEHFLQCGVANFVQCGCLPFAAADDLYGVTQHLNGGQIGAAQRASWLALWKHALGRDATAVVA